MSLAEFWLMFVLGLVSSIHCVQMCGPIVLSYSLADLPSRDRQGAVATNSPWPISGTTWAA
jgi:sulfite exporter TauE/SafE